MPLAQAIFGGAITLLGLFIMIWPRRFWYVTQGWWYDNPQDVRLSDAYRVWIFINGVCVSIVGLVALFQPLFGESH
jgi:hypothetical protein